MSFTLQKLSSENTTEITEMIQQLYLEDIGGEEMNQEKIKRTIHFLEKNPTNGEILLLLVDEVIVGYSIVINFWSNEFGGILLTIDELYIKAEFRGNNIGTEFIQYLKNSKYHDSVGIILEVLPENTKAYNFYLKNGFSEIKNKTLQYIFTK